MIDLLSLANVETVSIENRDETVTIYAKTTYHFGQLPQLWWRFIQAW
ncbi:Uncharacterised protein [Moraxella caviae]|uniref:Uncharacterized protein n=1 Tax=Moraxella caviae TaxID=34060 RepID=A0A378R8Q6_9GAMM|nr:hypothetical protein [Moraxella caviae]STZ13742.1 Uncharacterised protein [Moraxella caviae]